jgi:hypothetical protein
MRAAGAMIFGGAFFLVSAALVAVGWVSWRRTEATRQGRTASRAPPDSISAATVPLTRLAALAGVAAAGWGATIVTESVAAGLGLLAGSALITVTGFMARVIHLRADGHGMTVDHARLKSFDLRWGDLVALRPPISPLGGWHFQGRSGSKTLMPSDLWGVEIVVELAVKRAGLRYSGRRWSARV